MYGILSGVEMTGIGARVVSETGNIVEEVTGEERGREVDAVVEAKLVIVELTEDEVLGHG